ncbi:MAG: hypothetical protein ABIB47_05350 [Candidatus Woesearchaeota archaeon]
MIGVIGTLVDRFIDILIAPYNFRDMLWILTPLFLALLLIELYFARYKFEEAGWNVPYSNSLIMIFVSIDLFRILNSGGELSDITPRIALAVGVATLGVFLTASNFLHLWSREFAFGMSNHLPMNFIAYMSVVIIYSRIPLDFYTLIASFGIFVVFVLLILLIRFIVPKAIELDIEELKEREEAPTPR